MAVTTACVAVQYRIQHKAHTSLSGTRWCPGYGVKPKVWVRWTEAKANIGRPPVMWVGGCEGCDHTTQYWSWGASLGHMLEHQWIGCQGEKDRARDRRRKFARLAIDPDTEAQARLSCGGRTHGVMGEERGWDAARRTVVPIDVPSGGGQPPSKASTEQATLLLAQRFGDGLFWRYCVMEGLRHERA